MPRVVTAYEFLGPFDVIVVSFLLCAVLPVFMSICGAVVGGSSDFLLGGSMGFASARISLPIPNWWFGGSEEFMAAIHEELAEYQPLRRYLTKGHDPEPNEDMLKEEVDSCVLEFERHVGALFEKHVGALPLEKAKEANEVTTNIKQERFVVWVALLRWILERPDHDSRPVSKLLDARRCCMTVTDRGLAILSFLDLGWFLMYYFDQGRDFVPHFLVDEKHCGGKTLKEQASVYHLKELYITLPHFKVCASEKNAISWKIILVTNNKSLEEDEHVTHSETSVAIERHSAKCEDIRKSLEKPLLPVQSSVRFDE